MYALFLLSKKHFFLLSAVVLLLCLISACGKKQQSEPAPLSDSAMQVAQYDLPEIETAGELIAVTISGPETYYQYHGRDLGLQYALAENFANSMGLRLRMEIAPDTATLYQMLLHSKVDLIAYQLPTTLSQKMEVITCGANNTKAKTSWSVRKQSSELAEALNEWYKPNILSVTNNKQKQLLRSPLVYRHARAVYLNRGKGIISPYDHLFMQAALKTRRDWRLIAAQCYQESAFDPAATSWAGAKGLMQIMPGTASQLGVKTSDLTNPEINVAAAARYITILDKQFQDIPNEAERQKFVLAAYNGGFFHIRDAMRLAQKHQRNPHSWDAVSYYVLHLSEPQFYRDPVVKYGYMIGRETHNYVYSILNRWADYRGVARSVIPTGGDLHQAPEKTQRTNRFTRKNGDIIGRNDSIFRIE